MSRSTQDNQDNQYPSPKIVKIIKAHLRKLVQWLHEHRKLDFLTMKESRLVYEFYLLLNKMDGGVRWKKQCHRDAL